MLERTSCLCVQGLQVRAPSLDHVKISLAPSEDELTLLMVKVDVLSQQPRVLLLSTWYDAVNISEL